MNRGDAFLVGVLVGGVALFLLDLLLGAYR